MLELVRKSGATRSLRFEHKHPRKQKPRAPGGRAAAANDPPLVQWADFWYAREVNFGAIAQLARALAWHARGPRFESA